MAGGLRRIACTKIIVLKLSIWREDGCGERIRCRVDGWRPTRTGIAAVQIAKALMVYQLHV
jgi:hypothetical protein